SCIEALAAKFDVQYYIACNVGYIGSVAQLKAITDQNSPGFHKCLFNQIRKGYLWRGAGNNREVEGTVFLYFGVGIGVLLNDETGLCVYLVDGIQVVFKIQTF